MAALSEVFTGERVVVALFLARVLYAVPSHVFPSEALAVALLAVAALAIEIKAERSPASALGGFELRPGVSSGILLGTVTLPTVILARLTQVSRYDAEIEEFAYLKMQFWAVSMSCLGVLIFVYLTLSKSRGSNSSVLFNIFLFVCVGLYLRVSYLSLLEGASCVKMLWSVSHGVASVGLIWHILCTFPSCASIGEALLVSGGLVAYFGDMMLCTLLKINPVSLELLSDYARFGKKSEISTIIQGFFFSLLLLPLLYKFVLQFWTLFTRSVKSKSRIEGRRITGGIGQSILFYVIFGVMVVIIAPSWMQFVNNFHVHPILWIFDFLLTDPIGRLSLCIWWATIIFIAVFWFYSISKHSKIERILLRKYYHLVAVAMFSPALVIQPEFLDLAYGVAFSAFLALEVIRVWKIWPFGELVDQFMNAFTDHRDSDILIISHFSLLLGCAMPKWLSNGFGDRPLAPFAGILSLGIGDTMASVVGHKYGTLRWSKSGKKTIEGTAAGITSVLVACSVLLSILASMGYILSQHWFSLLLAVTVSGLLEAYTMQLDNAFIPLVFYSLLCL